MGIFGPPDVNKLAEKGDLPGLIKALSYRKDLQIRIDACKALSKIRDARIVEPLISALQDEEPGVYLTAARGLGELGNVCAVDPLSAVLKKGDPDFRITVVEALIKIGNSRTVEALSFALRDDDKSVRTAAMQGIDLIGEPIPDEQLGWYWAVKHNFEQCIALGQLAVEPLIKIFRDEGHEDQFDRMRAIKALGQIEDARAVEILLVALYMKPLFSEPAERALLKIGVPAVGPLIAYVQNPKNGYGRVRAAFILGEIGDTRAINPLRAILNDRDLGLSKRAEKALQKIVGTHQTTGG